MLVPLPRAASRRLISFLTFQISMFFSASLGCGSLDDMVAVLFGGGGATDGGVLFFSLSSEGQVTGGGSRRAAGGCWRACYAAVCSAHCSLVRYKVVAVNSKRDVPVGAKGRQMYLSVPWTHLTKAEA
jgi:hypothetical protein